MKKNKICVRGSKYEIRITIGIFAVHVVDVSYAVSRAKDFDVPSLWGLGWWWRERQRAPVAGV